MDMMTAGCCSENTCWTMPPEFVRVRYFFGQRLGVMELSDEAAYHTGKQAFHNARAHGVGVLCGLDVDRFVLPPATKTTVLRVHRGAALDACGREVLVGADQCIDVAAWFAKNKGRPELSGWTANTTQDLWIGLRYRECPSDPCAAPRDPCGCDNGGCEFGRVREGFELGLFTDKEKDKLAFTPFPDGLDHALASAMQGGGGDPLARLQDAIDLLVAKGCPTADDSKWLSLAKLTVTLDATPVPVDLSDPDDTQRVTLLPTSALQAMLLELWAQGAGAGLLSGGPTPGPIQFTSTGAASGTLAVPVTLAGGSKLTKAVPMVKATFQPSMVSLEQLDPVSGWSTIALGSVIYDDTTTPPQITIPVPTGLSAGSPPAKPPPIYRLTVEAPLATPVVDLFGRPLALPYVRTLTFVTDSSGNIQLNTAS